MAVEILGNFLKETQDYFDSLPLIAEKSAMLSINQVTERKALPAIRKGAENQVAFPRGYLDSPDRLEVTKRAVPGSLEAHITARDRATSLARFAPGQTPENSRGKPIMVQVKKGRTKVLKKAFLVRLRNGNIGLAVRLKQGQRPDKAYKPIMLDRGVYLLYGPSVDQVVKAVFDDSIPQIGDDLSNEFFRQFARLSSHG